MHFGEAEIKDVCKSCNEGFLSTLDSYGRDVVRQFFIKEYSPNKALTFNYNYDSLSRWLIKMAYNSCRAAKADESWFERNIEYIKGKATVPKYHVSLFGGLWVNMALVFEDVLGNIKLQINRAPRILLQGPINPETWRLDKSLLVNNIEIPNLEQKYLFRLGSGLFLLFLWDSDVEEESVLEWERIIDRLYPYATIKPSQSCIELRRCTDPFNVHTPYIIHSDAGISISEQFASCLRDNLRDNTL